MKFVALILTLFAFQAFAEEHAAPAPVTPNPVTSPLPKKEKKPVKKHKQPKASKKTS